MREKEKMYEFSNEVIEPFCEKNPYRTLSILMSLQVRRGLFKVL